MVNEVFAATRHLRANAVSPGSILYGSALAAENWLSRL
jgi:hypothetical protein